VNIFNLLKLESTAEQAQEIVDNSSLNKYVADTFRNTNRAILNGELIVSSLPTSNNVNQSNPDIKIYFLFSGRDCTNCIVETWEMVRGLVTEEIINDGNINLYYHENEGITLKNLISANSLRMEAEKVVQYDFSQILTEAEINISPILLFIDANKQVIDAYQPQPGNLATRDAFWNKWKRINNSF